MGALHLGFYLASWGMYRGSSRLLQKDYRVHIPVVEELNRPEYAEMRSLNHADWPKSDNWARGVVGIGHAIRTCYETVLKGSASDVLFTKVLLGTTATTVAYDRFVAFGMGVVGIAPKTFGLRGYAALNRFLYEHTDAFPGVQTELREQGTDYPLMKLLDMYLWQVGQQVEAGEEEHHHTNT